MTTTAENELLTRVGKGTPMGEMLRRYWIPFLTDVDLERDGQPMRVRLLGEDLLAFRDTSGRVGLIEPYCAHRLASLYFGRNEQNGLQCVYHGWSFNCQGTGESPGTPKLYAAATRFEAIEKIRFLLNGAKEGLNGHGKMLKAILAWRIGLHSGLE